MFSSYVRFTDSTREDLVDHYDTLADAIRDMRELWYEDRKNYHVLIRDENGTCVAMMFKDVRRPQLCETRYLDGRIEYHRCEPWLDEEQTLWVRVTALDRPFIFAA